MEYSDLKKLADIRLDDAKMLYKNNRLDGAFYMCGYTIELALKARICKLLNINEYPEGRDYKQVFQTHDCLILLKLAGLEKNLELTKTDDPYLFIAWSGATDWNPECRYQITNRTKKDVGQRLAHTIDILKWMKKLW